MIIAVVVGCLVGVTVVIIIVVVLRKKQLKNDVKTPTPNDIEMVEKRPRESINVTDKGMLEFNVESRIPTTQIESGNHMKEKLEI